MKYERFDFRNFKGITEMSLDLTGDVTTLIGLNESGKTTLLEGIFCFTYGAENLDAIDPNMASLRDPERWIPISRRANFNDQIRITAALSLSDQDKAALKRHMQDSHDLHVDEVQTGIEITETYRFENSRTTGSSKTWDLELRGRKGKQRTVRAFGAKTEEWQAAVTFLKALLPSIWYFPNFLFELPDRFDLATALDQPANEDADRSLFYRSTFDHVLQQLGYGANLDTHVVARLKSADEADHRNLQSVLLDMAREMTRAVFEGWNRIFGRAPAAQEVDLRADTSSAGAPYLELKIKGVDGYYDLSERSLGFRWFFMFLLMTTYRGATDENRRSLFLLDEPASNLHSTAQAELLQSFEALSKSCHLVYTTHSHHLINLRWLDSAYVVRNTALEGDRDDYFSTHIAGRTSISATRYRRFVAENPDKTSYFQPVLDLLGYRPSALELVPAVVLLEGKSDFFLLKYATEILDLESDLHFVPGGGAGSLDTLIRLYVGWAGKFLVVLDGDREGLRQEKRLEDEFGACVAGRIRLLPDLCRDSRPREIEELLTDADRQSLLSRAGADIGGTTKKAIQMAVMELYARREVVALERSTRSALEGILGELSVHMEDGDDA